MMARGPQGFSISSACPRLFAPAALPGPWTDHEAQARANPWGGVDALDRKAENFDGVKISSRMIGPGLTLRFLAPGFVHLTCQVGPCYRGEGASLVFRAGAVA